MANDLDSAVGDQEHVGTWVSRDGLRLCYRDYPGRADTPPLICLHGLTRNSRDFEAFATRYAGRFRILTPDFRGRGMSGHDPVSSHYVPPTYAADILQLLDQLGITQAIFVGTSLGGIVTMLIASMQPDRVAAAILNDVGPDLDPEGIDRIKSYVGKAVKFGDWGEAAAYIADINHGQPVSHSQEDWIKAAHRLCKEDGDSIIFDYDTAIAEPFNAPGDASAIDMWPHFRALGKAPLLIVRGENSDLLSPITAQAMLVAAPGARLVTIPGVGHAPDLTEPAAIAAIDSFLFELSFDR
jgi:pimeloyl-ACP methyl ester carboxylesterase